MLRNAIPREAFATLVVAAAERDAVAAALDAEIRRLESRLDVLEAELREMRESEMWQAGAAVRSLRPGG